MYTRLNRLATRFLPPFIYDRLIGTWSREGLKKYTVNTGWIFVAKVTSFIVSFLTLAIVARYLGPELYGKISYAQSFVALFSMIASLGIDTILYRDLVAHKEREGEILGTATLLKLVCGIIALIATLSTALLTSDDTIFIWLIGLISLTFIFQPFGVISHFFSANVASKYPAYITLAISFLIPALKLIVIFLGQGIIYFAAIIAFEAFFNAIAHLFYYIHTFKKNLHHWTISRTYATSLFLDSWPLFLAGMSGYIYGRIDQVMLLHFLDATAVGLYDAAVRLSEIWGFFPGVLITSLFPAIVNAKATNTHEYHKRLRSLSILTLSLAAMIAALVCLMAPLFIALLYGSEFSTSASILRIYIWSLVGAISVSLMQSYLVTERKSVLILTLTVGGALINVVLNWCFIPLFGAQGAAIATIATYVAIGVIFIIIQKRHISPLP